MSTTNYASLIEAAGAYVTDYMTAHADKNLVYHNLDHTRSVVTSAIHIANHYQLPDKDYFVVVAAAWFHDIGYFNGAAQFHEERAAVMVETFFSPKGVDADTVAAIRGCILATEMPQHPQGLLQEIVCDADLYHFGTDQFSERNKLMRKEIELVYNKSISKDDWRKGTLKLLEQHHFHTDYCRLLLTDPKQENVLRLRQKLHVDATAPDTTTTPATNTTAAPPRQKTTQPGRGIETMFRITSGNNQRLSDMADNKAHILITVNSIILSAIISLLLRKLEDSSFLTYPTFTLLAVSVVTIVVSILATRPSIPSGIFTKKDIDDKTVNLLFFGNFYKMDLHEYSEGMKKVMSDSDFLYGTLIKDIYSQGVVLGRKYRLLRLSYNIFMFGLIISVLGFIAVFLLYT